MRGTPRKTVGGGPGGATRQTHHHTAGHQLPVGKPRHPRNRTSVARRPTRTHLDTSDVLPKDAVAYTGAAQRPGPIEHTKRTMTNTNRPSCQYGRYSTRTTTAQGTHHTQDSSRPPRRRSAPFSVAHSSPDSSKPSLNPHRIPANTHRLKMMLLPPTALKAVSALPSMAAMGNMATIVASGQGRTPQPPPMPHGAAPTE